MSSDIRVTVADIERIFPEDQYSVMRRNYAPNRLNINGEVIPEEDSASDLRPERFTRLNRWDGRARMPKLTHMLLLAAAIAALWPIAARFIH